MADIAAVKTLIEPEVERLGYRLVRVVMTGGHSDPTLQVMAERAETGQLDLGDCERISRQLSGLLDEADPIEGGYRLEVSSPGIDRPLTRLSDFDAWKGHEARVTASEQINGRKQFTGTLEGVGEAEAVLIAGKDGQHYSIPFSSIASAKLLLTDALIDATAPLSTEGADTIQMQED